MTVTDKELHDMMARSCLAERVEMNAQTLHEMSKELIELRAYKQQVERVKACKMDDCVNGRAVFVDDAGDGVIDAPCFVCMGLP